MNDVASIGALCAALAVHLTGREPWRDAVAALSAATSFVPGDGVAPIQLQLHDLAGPIDVITAVRVAAGSLQWRQNPNYTDASFLSRYAYAELVGPSGHAASDRCSIGLLYLAPGTFYPAHSHPAEEAYHLLSGRSEWWQGALAPHVAAAHVDTSALRSPGDRVLHPSGVPHAMRSGSRPLLALYIWRGDLRVAARLAETADRP